MTKNKILLTSLSVALPLVIAMLFAMPPHVTATDAKNVDVRVDNFTFTPETITVPVHATVTWVNKDDIPHVIASSDGVFKSRALDTDDQYSYTFTKPGTYTYYCSIHPKMVGKVVVH